MSHSGRSAVTLVITGSSSKLSSEEIATNFRGRSGNIGFGDWTGLPIRTGSCENDESILLLFISVADRIDIFSNSADCAIHLDFLHNWKSEKTISC